MIYFNKIFKIPGPKDLGMSDTNHAMPMDLFADEDDYTWELYYDRVKKDYPVKYFFASTLPEFFASRWRRLSMNISDIIYWVKCHTMQKYKYHLLNLSQPKEIVITDRAGESRKIINQDYYKCGWCDTDSRMLFAIFNLLNQYVEIELPVILKESSNDPSIQYSKKNQDEALAIYHWWNVERKLDQEQISVLRSKWFLLKKEKRTAAAERAHNEIVMAEFLLEQKTDEMIDKLMKIRRTLWT